MSNKKNNNVSCETDLSNELKKALNEIKIIEAEIIRIDTLTNLARDLLEELENEFKD